MFENFQMIYPLRKDVNNFKMRGLLIYIVQCFKKEKLTFEKK